MCHGGYDHESGVNHMAALTAQSGKCKILPNLTGNITTDYLSQRAAQVSGDANVTILS